MIPRSAFFCFCILAALAATLAGCQGRTAPEGAAASVTPEQPAGPDAGLCLVVPSVPAPSPIPVWQPVAGKTVILDPGHGGKDLGAAHFGLREKDINLDVALRAADRLRALGVIVHLTRSDDVFVPLPQRSAIANRLPHAIFVSVHVNASQSNPLADGIETYVLAESVTDAERRRHVRERYKVSGADSVQSKQALANLTVHSRSRSPALAASVQKNLVSRLGTPDRGVRKANLAVLRETYFCPAILVELGFLTNARTASAMAADTWRQGASDALCDGIIDFLRQPD